MSGLADAPNTGGVVAGIEARFARVDAERRQELDRLIKADAKVNTLPTMPSMHDGEQGKDMAKTKKRVCCGSLGNRHLAGCPTKKTPEADSGAVALALQPKLRKAATWETRGLAKLDVPALLELRDQVENELLRREEQLQQQLAAIRGAPKRAA